MTLEAYLEKALEAEYGIMLKFENANDTRRFRRRLYAERERLRSEGKNHFDQLSIIIQNTNELLIFKRPPNVPKNDIKPIEWHNLGMHDLPRKILSRGKSRFGFYIS